MQSQERLSGIKKVAESLPEDCATVPVDTLFHKAVAMHEKYPAETGLVGLCLPNTANKRLHFDDWVEVAELDPSC